MKKHLLFGLLYFLGLISNSSFGQEAFDPAVYKNRIDSPDGYKLRKSRYEGLYKRPYSRPKASVVSLVQGKLEYDLARKEEIFISYPNIPGVNEIGVTGQSHGLSIHYHLDFILRTKEKMTIPVEDVILNKNIYSSNLGMYGYQGKITAPTTYIPINVRTKNSNESDKSIHLVLIASAPLSSVGWRYSKFENGSACGTSKEGKTKSGNFPDGEPIELSLLFDDSVKMGDVLCIDVTGTVQGENEIRPLISYKMIAVR